MVVSELKAPTDKAVSFGSSYLIPFHHPNLGPMDFAKDSLSVSRGPTMYPQPAPMVKIVEYAHRDLPHRPDMMTTESTMPLILHSPSASESSFDRQESVLIWIASPEILVHGFLPAEGTPEEETPSDSTLVDQCTSDLASPRRSSEWSDNPNTSPTPQSTVATSPPRDPNAPLCLLVVDDDR